tara:strand:- start:2097 stop:3341 length:1245 start_codon:yes stop_codon:yes gene_type:complete
LKRSTKKIFHKLIQEIINDGDGDIFKKNLIELRNSEKESFKEIILQNKLSPNLISFIHKNNLKNLFDKASLKEFENQFKRYQINSLSSIRELHLLEDILRDKGLSPIYLKGIALQPEYDDISLRPFVDIDILLKKSEILRAFQALHENDFLAKSEKEYLNEKNIDDFCKNFHHVHLITKNNISIELHHRVTQNRYFFNCPITSKFFKNIRQINYYGKIINVPSIENLAIHQLCHFFLSGFKGLLRTLSDIRIISNNHDIDWYKLISSNRNKKIQKCLYLSLEIMNFNNIPIEGMNDIRNFCKDSLLNDEIILNSQEKLFDIHKRVQGENLYEQIYKPQKLFTILTKILFPKRNILIYRYKIQDPTIYNILKTYLKYLFLQTRKLGYLFIFFQNRKTSSENIKYTRSIDIWFNKD